MRVRVTRPFRDKRTKEVYATGRVIEVTDGRFKEIRKGLGDGYLQALPEETSESCKEKKAR
jgi:hypothetical protein